MTETAAGRELVLQELTADRLDALTDFFAKLPEGDRTFVKEPVEDQATVARWASREVPGHRWLACDGQDVVGYVAVLPLTGWSNHVGELRLVVAPQARGQGIGGRLAEHALKAAVELGLRKLVVEVVAVQESTIALFNTLGFRAEALLTDQIRDGRGELQDLVVLAHDVESAAEGLELVGADETS